MDGQERPWKGTATPCDKVDKDLFQACTEITVRDGSLARFWHDSWLQGKAPRNMAPSLFPLAARKNLTVKEALGEGRWMRGLQRISSVEQLEQFVELWSTLTKFS